MPLHLALGPHQQLPGQSPLLQPRLRHCTAICLRTLGWENLDFSYAIHCATVQPKYIKIYGYLTFLCCWFKLCMINQYILHVISWTWVPTEHGEDSSFKKVQETMQVVADEFKHQGYVMKGPCSSLASGKAKNVARDMQRGFNRKQLDPATWEPLLKVFPLWFHPKAISWIQ